MKSKIFAALLLLLADAHLSVATEELTTNSKKIQTSDLGTLGKVASLAEDERIVGGTTAPKGAAPYQVSIRTLANFHFCGGSVLNDRWILTAAHCVKGNFPNNVKVVVGTHRLNERGQQYDTEKIFGHEYYNALRIQNDIALILVRGNIKFSDFVQPIQLPKDDIEGGAPLVLTGWGRTSFPGFPSNDLKIISLKSLSREECRRKMVSFHEIYETQVCSLTRIGEGACHGDSGGPLVSNGKVVGIVSWGLPCARGFPDIYTRVYSYLGWINDKISSEAQQL